MRLYLHMKKRDLKMNTSWYIHPTGYHDLLLWRDPKQEELCKKVCNVGLVKSGSYSQGRMFGYLIQILLTHVYKILINWFAGFRSLREFSMGIPDHMCTCFSDFFLLCPAIRFVIGYIYVLLKIHTHSSLLGIDLVY